MLPLFGVFVGFSGDAKEGVSPYLKIEINSMRSWLSKSIIPITKWGFEGIFGEVSVKVKVFDLESILWGLVRESWVLFFLMVAGTL